MTQNKKTIVVVSTTAPIPISGACQQDRYYGLHYFIKRGWNVHFICRYHVFQDVATIKAELEKLGVTYTLIPHTISKTALLLGMKWSLFLRYFLLDGAALEYAQTEYLAQVDRDIKKYTPSLLWLDYTYTWPVLTLKSVRGIKTIMRSLNNEALHYKEENSFSFWKQCMYYIKLQTEVRAAKMANFVAAITPKEAEFYKKINPNTVTLPLRSLYRCFYKKQIQETKTLKAICMVSSFNVLHNRKAFLYLVTQIVPLVRKKIPGIYTFYITGSKFPEEFKQYLADDVVFTGFVPNISDLLKEMDVAVVPSVAGQGMQQKIFEPLCSFIPVITHQVAQYPFVSGEHIFLASSPEDFVNALCALQDVNVRQSMANNAYNMAHNLFSEASIDTVLNTIM